MIPEQSEGKNHTSKINVFPLSKTVFFLLGGKKNLVRQEENINFTRVVVILALLGHQTSYSENKFVCLSSHENDPILALRRLVVFVGQIPTGIKFAGYVIFIFSASSGTWHTKIGTIIERGHLHLQITKNSMCCVGAIGDSFFAM